MASADLQQCLLDRDELTADQQAGLVSLGSVLGQVLHHYGRRGQAELNRRYVALDPDNETRPQPAAEADSEATAEQTPGDRAADTHAVNEPRAGSVRGAASETDAERQASEAINAAAESCTEAIRRVLLAANYSPLSRTDIEAAVGVASQWGVPLHVDFNVFKQLAVYTRGDIMGVRRLRVWNLPWREQLVEVPIYQRVVVVFQLVDDYNPSDALDPKQLHLRMFKNIPKLDVDMLLPGTRVRISWIDRTRIVVPSLGGIGMTIWKIVRTALLVAALSVYTAAILLGLVLAAVGYVVKSVLNYFQTRNRYMLNLTRSLYHQKLDSNAGVIYRLREEAQQQRYNEVLLGYYAMLSQQEAISRRRLKRRVERILRESIELEVDFDVDKTLALMQTLGLCEQLSDGKYRCAVTQAASDSLHRWWDAQSLSLDAPALSASAQPGRLADQLDPPPDET
ncbi:hypothetical protein UC8_20580 [Roseimaritima ulvae]|uniref:DUF3754 domain-containing protein n=2 Tax=Roseimaritima ulvae TaxID=980254 RepID=A0A5B9QMB7_9BACT|nr:hypothetical protein UC8_20580 [Roseimaritima ulvae]